MGWTAGVDVTTGDLITAAQWNNFLGASGSLEYLQSWTQNDVTASRAINGTVYRNTDDKIKIVSINIRSNIDDDGAGGIVGQSDIQIHSDAATPPTTLVAQVGAVYNLIAAAGASDYLDNKVQAVFIVLPSNYYKATPVISGAGANPTLLDWFEWGA